MPEYELTPTAESDLLAIAVYTIETWGLEQASRYEAALERHFRGLARREVVTSTPLPHRPELQSSRCEHHYVFTQWRSEGTLLIIAVLHENMDLMTRLRDLLEPRSD